MTVNREDVQRWVAAGVIDDATAVRILSFEESSSERESRAERPGVVEILLYLAAAIIAAGTTVLVGTNWEHLNSAGRILVPALAAVAAFATGQWLRMTSEPPLVRAASLLWLLAGVLVTASVAIASVEADAGESNIALFAGVAALVASVALWVPMRMHPQIVGIGAAATLFAIGVSVQSAEDWIVATLGAVLAAFGLVALVATEYGILTPRASARLVAGAALAFGGFWAGMPPSPAVTELLALAVVVVLVAAGIRFQSLVYVAFGVLTAFAGMLKLILRHVDDPTLAGLALVGIGVVLLVAIAGLGKARPWERPDSASAGEA